MYGAKPAYPLTSAERVRHTCSNTVAITSPSSGKGNAEEAYAVRTLAAPSSLPLLQ